MRIRNATTSDLPCIVAIYNASIPERRATADLKPISVESRENWFAAHNPSKHPIWVVENQDCITGWLSFQPFYGRPAYEQTAEISIYIASEYQQQGLGKMLLTEAINRSPEFNIKTLLAFVFGHNYPSLQLFKKYGFQVWGNLPKIALMDDKEYDLIILGLRIN
ncbi:MAG: GNAT family N-acetyltransferase [Mastigocoleus sp.]